MPGHLVEILARVGQVADTVRGRVSGSGAPLWVIEELWIERCRDEV